MIFPEADPGTSYRILPVTFNSIICVSIVYEIVFMFLAIALQHTKAMRGASPFEKSLHLIIFTCPLLNRNEKILKIFSDISDESSKRNRKYDEFIKLKIYSASFNVEPEDPALLNVQYKSFCFMFENLLYSRTTSVLD